MPAPITENLAGEWRFALDPNYVGSVEKWFATDLPGNVKLPGDLTWQGIGNAVTLDTPWTGQIVDRSYFTEPEYALYREPDNLKIPFWLQPVSYYKGAAWYQRDIEIPVAWEKCSIRLSLERPHIATRVWLNEREIGTNDSLSAPHEFDLGNTIVPGRHRLSILVDNLRYIDVGPNSHSVTDHTQGNWNGIIGRIELQALGSAWIDDLQIYPNIAAKSVWVTGKIAGDLTASIQLDVSDVAPEEKSIQTQLTTIQPQADGSFGAKIFLGANVRLWDEFDPALYRLTATPAGGKPKTSTFGFREIGRDGAQLTINGRKLFLRGALDCALFPKTGHPPTDVDSWKRQFATIKEYGLNHVRFHSWCPPEAAFAAGDEMGLYFQIECASWANTTTSLGDGKPVDDWIYAEADRILMTYGNHPSFALMAYGNEPGGEHHRAYLSKWVAHYKNRDSRRIFTCAGGWPAIPENHYHNMPEPRIQAWGQGLGSRVNSRPPETATDYIAYNEVHHSGNPVVSHEVGQWCAYPNFNEMSKYTGPLKPKNFEIFRETLAAHHMADQARDFLMASGKHQTLLYKEEIESTLRTTNMSGFQLLGLQDFSGQGTALVGVLDAFWESKGYVTAEEYRRFCNATVLLARLPKRVFTSDEILTASVEAAHFGSSPLLASPVSWRLLSDNGQSVAQGMLPAVAIPVGNGIKLGNISINLANVLAPNRYKLLISFADGSIENDWEIWVYKSKVNTTVPADITVAHQLDPQMLDTLAAGGKVFWLIPPGKVVNDPKHPIEYGFSPIFWNTAWTKRQPPTTLGILCDPQAPALALFPTDFHSNWQWWYPIQKGQPMILDALPPALRPIVQVIDDWFTNRRLGLVFEALVGNGKLLVSSIDLEYPVDPVNAQLRESLLAYMDSDNFQPTIEVALEQLHSLMMDSACRRP